MAARENSPSQQNRVGKVILYRDDVRRLLDLPEEFVVDSIFPMFDPAGICVVVSSDSLAIQPEDGKAPLLEGSWNKQMKYDENGKIWYRMEWSRELDTLQSSAAPPKVLSAEILTDTKFPPSAATVTLKKGKATTEVSDEPYDSDGEPL